MLRRLIGIGFIAGLAVLTACKSSQTTSVKPAANSSVFQIRSYDTQVLPNGMTVLWIPDNSLPYLSLQMMFRSGSAQDPVGKEGLAAFTAALLEKGTAKRTATQLADDLEQLGSGFGVEVQSDYMVAVSSALTMNGEQMLTLYREILRQPTFPKEEIERQRQIVLAGLQKLADRPNEFTDYLMAKYLFGDHPYGHLAAGTPQSLRSLTVNDVKKFYAQNFNPSTAVLAVTGQITEDWKRRVVGAFADWQSEMAKVPEIPDFPKWKGTQVLLVDKADLNQAQIQVGFKGVPRNVPEYLQVRAALKILGESFGSRLFEEIRVKRGLTYGISSYFDARAKAGPMGIDTFSRVDKAGETVTETLNTYRLFVKSGVSQEEVETVKSLMRGQFPRFFETPESLAKQILVLKRYDISDDYLRDYMANINKMDRESINAAIKKYFDPENLRVLVFAPRKSVEESLKQVGHLEVKPYKEFLQ